MATQTGKSLRKLRTSMTPRAWRVWLNSAEGEAKIGLENCRVELLRCDERDNARRNEIRGECPSGSWADSVIDDKAQFPPGGTGRPYPHAVRMIRSIVTGRLTPPQCLALEDMLDAMTPHQALFYESPDGCSPSAAVIMRIGAVRAKEIGGNWR